MLVLYRIYQLFIMVPLMLATTLFAALVTAIGCMSGSSRFWGYWPAHIWARICCALTLVRVKVSGRENIDPHTSYVFVANHQGAYDIFSIYGYLNHNFKWMMKKGLRKIPAVGGACAIAGHIFVDNSSPAAIRQTMEKAEHTLRDGMSLVVFPEGSRTFTGKMLPQRRLSAGHGIPSARGTCNHRWRIRSDAAHIARSPLGNHNAHHPPPNRSPGRRSRPPTRNRRLL